MYKLQKSSSSQRTSSGHINSRLRPQHDDLVKTSPWARLVESLAVLQEFNHKYRELELYAIIISRLDEDYLQLTMVFEHQQCLISPFGMSLHWLLPPPTRCWPPLLAAPAIHIFSWFLVFWSSYSPTCKRTMNMDKSHKHQDLVKGKHHDNDVRIGINFTDLGHPRKAT